MAEDAFRSGYFGASEAERVRLDALRVNDSEHSFVSRPPELATWGAFASQERRSVALGNYFAASTKSAESISRLSEDTISSITKSFAQFDDLFPVVKAPPPDRGMCS